jgi:hypothetical protein
MPSPQNNTDGHADPELDADMTGRDIIDALRRLRIAPAGKIGVRIDRGVRDYIVHAVVARCGNSK